MYTLFYFGCVDEYQLRQEMAELTPLMASMADFIELQVKLGKGLEQTFIINTLELQDTCITTFVITTSRNPRESK